MILHIRRLIRIISLVTIISVTANAHVLNEKSSLSLSPSSSSAIRFRTRRNGRDNLSMTWMKPPHDDNVYDNGSNRNRYELSRRDMWEQTTASAAVAAASWGGCSSSGLMLPPQPAHAATTSDIVVPKVKLGKGTLEVSRTIQGYWQLAGGHGRYTESDAIDNMNAHYKRGITTIDTADIYGPSELIIGKYLKSSSQQQQQKATVCTKFCCFRFLDVSHLANSPYV